MDLPPVELPDVLLARAEVNRALQKSSGAPLDNSHPVEVAKDALGQGQSGANAPRPKPEPKPKGNGDTIRQEARPADPVPSPSIEPTAPEPTAPAPTNPESPGPSDLFPTLPLPPDGNASEGKDDVAQPKPEVKKKKTKKVTEGLGGAVETILPDEGPSLGLPEH